MSAEGWGNNGEAQFGSRNFNNSNFNRGRREGSNGGGGGGGYPSGGRPSYNSNSFGGPPRSGSGYGQNSAGGGGGGGRQYYGSQERPQRQNFGGPAGGGGGGQPRFNNFQQSGASEKIDIESNKVGMVIGRGGGKIREIQENFNVHVKIGKLKWQLWWPRHSHIFAIYCAISVFSNYTNAIRMICLTFFSNLFHSFVYFIPICRS